VQITAVTFVKKNTATFGKLIIAVYGAGVFVCISCMFVKWLE